MNQQNKPFQAQDEFDIGPVNTRAHEYHNNLKFLLSHIQDCVADFYCRVLTAKRIYNKSTGSPLVLKN